MQQTYRETPVAGLVWFNIIVGLLMLVLGGDFAKWGIARMTGQAYHTGINWLMGEKVGQEVDFWELQGHTALSQAGVFIFGLVILLEAATIALSQSTHRPLVRRFFWFTLLLTIGCVALNLYVSLILLKDQILPLMSLLAVAFGGYMCIEQWANLRGSGAAGVPQDRQNVGL